MNKSDPFSPDDAKRIAREILSSGQIAFSRHALAEMKTDRLTQVDCVNVIRGGFVEKRDFERGTWRYRFTTRRIAVVVAFRSTTELVVVTAWRAQR